MSALLFGGIPGEAFDKVRSKRLVLLTSALILTELARLLKTKFQWEDADIADLIRSIGYNAELIKPGRRVRIIKDEPDNRVLECAVEGRADFIVSGDKHLLMLKEYKSIPVVRAAELIAKM